MPAGSGVRPCVKLSPRLFCACVCGSDLQGGRAGARTGCEPAHSVSVPMQSCLYIIEEIVENKCTSVLSRLFLGQWCNCVAHIQPSSSYRLPHGGYRRVARFLCIQKAFRHGEHSTFFTIMRAFIVPAPVLRTTTTMWPESANPSLRLAKP